MIGVRRAGRIPADEARQELENELSGLPGLFAGEIDQPFVAVPVGSSVRAVEAERVGIVFVHGVGSQRKGDALREFGTPLVDWLEEWHRSRGVLSGFRVSWSEISPGGDEPASAVLAIPRWSDEMSGSVRQAQTWVLTEAWWASRVEAPPVGTMINWAFQRLKHLFAGLYAGALAAASHPLYASGFKGAVERSVQLGNSLVIAVLYVVVQLFVFLLLLVLAFLTVVPLPSLSRLIFVRLGRPLLTDNVGDFFVCMYDRLQAVYVRQSVLQAANWLVRTQGCSRILIAAHSGGTVVAVDALGTSDVIPADGRLPEASPLNKVTTLLTFGSPLNVAWAERGAGSTSKPPREIPQILHGSTRWLNFWTYFDWALPGRALDHGPAKGGNRQSSLPVTNGLSPISDHGGYLENYEEFVSRLAQEADSPSSLTGGYEFMSSRFWPGYAADAERVWRRYARTSMLTWWRAAAIAAAIGVFAARYAIGGHNAAADGLFIVSLVPVAGEALLAALTAPATAFSPPADGTSEGAAAFDLARWIKDAGQMSVVLLFFGLVMAGVYALGVMSLFAGWHRDLSRCSARVELPEQSVGLRRRSVAFGVLLTLIALPLVVAPPFAQLPSVIGKLF